MVKKSDLMLKEVIDINLGKRLGYIEDVDINVEDGSVIAVVVPGTGDGVIMRLFSKKQDIIIDWNNIEKIGEDVILVNV